MLQVCNVYQRRKRHQGRFLQINLSALYICFFLWQKQKKNFKNKFELSKCPCIVTKKWIYVNKVEQKRFDSFIPEIELFSFYFFTNSFNFLIFTFVFAFSLFSFFVLEICYETFLLMYARKHGFRLNSFDWFGKYNKLVILLCPTFPLCRFTTWIYALRGHP